MLNRNKVSLASLSILISLSFLFLFSFYSENLKHPNKYLFSDAGDGLKSFYVFNYHIFNDTSSSYTQSVNYPYGEVHVFSDGQTVFANCFRIVDHILPGAKNYSIAFLNLLMLLSYVFCFLILYLILKKLFIPDVIAITGAFAIGILSPQIFRFLGHPSLSYCFIFPLTWYLQILYFESNQWRYSVALMLLLLIAPFIHGYYILICGLFVFFNWLIQIIQTKNIKYFKATLPHVLIQVGIPVLFFQLYLHAFDHHAGRSTDPFGLLVYTANFSTVFVPNHPPFNSVFQYLYSFQFQNWEGWAYIGLPMVIIAVYSCFKILRYALRGKFKLIVKPVLPRILQGAIWAAILLLLYSFAYPFKWHAMFLLDWLTPLKQFRALGRFAWIFFYVFSVYGVYILYLSTRLLYQKKLFVTAYSMQLIFFGILFLEGIVYHKEIAPKICSGSNQFNPQLLYKNYSDAIHAVDLKRYQAILPLPYYHIGSEAQTRLAPDSTMKSSMFFAFHSGLPLMASSSARCSMEESRKLIQLLAPSYINKEAMPDFKDKRPFLITFSKDALDDDEMRLIRKGVKVYSNSNLELYELSYDSLFENTAQQELDNFDAIKDSLFKQNEYLTDKQGAFIFTDDFESQKCDTALRSKGALRGVLSDYNFVLQRQELPIEEGKEYTASFWIYNKGSFVNSGFAVVEECNPDGTGVEWRQLYDIARCANIDGDWSLIEMKFTLKKKGDMIAIFTKGNDGSEKTVYRDKLLIRPTNVNVYSALQVDNEKTTLLYKNNFFIRH